MDLFRNPANVLSMGNLVCGTLALLLAPYDILWSIRLVVLGSMFDAFDGTVARHRGPTEEGKWLDGISDRVTQVLAPSLLLVVTASFHPLALAAGTLFVLLGVIRIVRTDAAQPSTVGLPMWPVAFFILLGILGNIPLLMLQAVVLAAVSFSFLPLEYRLPLTLRKPEVRAHGLRSAVFAVALRIVPLSLLLASTFFDWDAIVAPFFWIFAAGTAALTLLTIIPSRNKTPKL